MLWIRRQHLLPRRKTGYNNNQHLVVRLQFWRSREYWVLLYHHCSHIYGSNRSVWKLRGAYNNFQTFFVQAFKIVVDSWKITMLLLYILWGDCPIFMISRSNEQLQQQLEYTLLKPDCHSWWISKMQSGREDTLKERCAIKFCFKLGKNAATETYGMRQTAFWPSCMNRESVLEWHKRFKEATESIREE